MSRQKPYTVRGRTVFTEEQVQERIQQALATAGASKELIRVSILSSLGITEMNAKTTPSARWFQNGEPSPFPDLVNQERGSLMLGNLTDFELANEVYMYGDRSDAEKQRAILNGEIISIAYLTAAKERIRWLSTHLESALASEKALLDRVTALEQTALDSALSDMAVDVHAQVKEEIESDIEHLAKQIWNTQIEHRAKEIYDSWSDMKDWVHWVPGGNSDMQDKARDQARADLEQFKESFDKAAAGGHLQLSPEQAAAFEKNLRENPLERNEALVKLLDRPRPWGNEPMPFANELPKDTE